MIIKDTTKIISIQELMKGRNQEFDNSVKIRVMRLSENYKWDFNDNTIDSIHSLCKKSRAAFLEWVRVWPLTKKNRSAEILNSDYVVFMVSEKGLLSRLLGVYKVLGKEKQTHEDIYIKLEECSGFEALNEKVIVKWGEKNQSSQAWSQTWYKNETNRIFNEKYVVKIDEGISSTIVSFISYNDVNLRYSQLEDIIKNEDAIWKAKLESVNCIYCIFDINNGKKYIGSTYGNNKQSETGIWNRWKYYIDTEGHGDDAELKKIFDADNNYPKNNFRWMILEILPINITSKEAIMRENVYKEKFMTRDKRFGYNQN